ncbi:MAG: sulfite exporter TauE/SafE family protein [Bacteroidia bacterium]|nr:sulfite exporter TauE/SafE family protein [Bacteroidia bacterium]
MWYIAFTLGLMGSLHCVGMCGPLAIAFSKGKQNSKFSNLIASLSYNFGRTITYAVLGLLFGLLGSFLFLADLQKVLSIALGLILVTSFLFSIDLDQKISGSSYFKTFYQKVQNILQAIMKKADTYPSILLGLANGLLPCGLVYLALAGALATGNLLLGMAFMFIFGLGTIPMLLALSLSNGAMPQRWRIRFQKILPYVSLCFGVFLIYRGFVVEMPTELNFWEALKNPVMCH